MAIKPSINLPKWATNPPVASAVEEPPEGKKESGYIYAIIPTKGEKPIINYDNWLSLSTYEWIKWLSENTNLSSRVSNNTSDTVAPNETLILTNAAQRTITISDTITDGDKIEIKEASGNASEIDSIIINAPAGYTFEEGSTDAEIQVSYMCLTFKVFNNKLYLV